MYYLSLPNWWKQQRKQWEVDEFNLHEGQKKEQGRIELDENNIVTTELQEARTDLRPVDFKQRFQTFRNKILPLFAVLFCQVTQSAGLYMTITTH